MITCRASSVARASLGHNLPTANVEVNKSAMRVTVTVEFKEAPQAQAADREASPVRQRASEARPVDPESSASDPALSADSSHSSDSSKRLFAARPRNRMPSLLDPAAKAPEPVKCSVCGADKPGSGKTCTWRTLRGAAP
jgi:hypothetical protein